jgi:hypothetical protein
VGREEGRAGREAAERKGGRPRVAPATLFWPHFALCLAARSTESPERVRHSELFFDRDVPILNRLPKKTVRPHEQKTKKKPKEKPQQPKGKRSDRKRCGAGSGAPSPLRS